MAKIIIDKEKCKGCLLCISFCPQNLISVDKKLNKQGIQPVKFSPAKGGGSPPPDITGSRHCREEAGKENPGCLGCTMCAVICPDCCIEVYK